MADPVTIGIEVAIMAASMAITASQKIEGPRLDTLDVSLAEYGTPIPRFWGIRRFDVPIIWAEKLREKKVTTKTKGGKYANYKYYGTWAVAIADHEIDSVSRIWLDKHLAFDVTGSGPVSIGALFGDKDSVKLANGTNMRVHLGDQTDPDPRIESWCEDRYGANTAPAYKDVAYIVFQDIPLEKFGNRIPQISIEAIHTKTNIFPYEIKAASHYGTGLLAFTRDFTRFVTMATGGYAIWDTPSRTPIIVSDTPPCGVGEFIFTAENLIYIREGATSVRTLTYDVALAGDAVTLGHTASEIYYAGGYGCLTALTGHNIVQLYDGSGITELDVGYKPLGYLNGPDGMPWSLGVSGTNIRITQIGGGTDLTVANVAGGGATPYGLSNSAGNICLFQGTTILVIDTSGTILHSGSRSGTVDRETIVNHDGSDLIWSESNQYSLIDGSLVRSVPYATWGAGFGSNMYDPVNNALFGEKPATSSLNWLYLDRVSSNGVTLQTVVDDVSDWCGLSGQDTTALTQTVQGYSITQGSGKDMIAPLLDIHDVDPRPHDFSVQFVVRGAASAGTITTSELARDGEESRYVASITQDTDLPRKITFSFADKGHDQQANNVIAQRPLDSVDAQRERSIDLGTYVETPSGAQQLADRYLRRQWMGRQKFTLGLTAQRLALEPADVYSLQLDDITVKARLTKVTLTNGKLQTEWERDGASIHTVGTGAGASMDGRDPEVIYIPGPTKGFVKDIPLLSDSDSNSNPLLYYGAGPYLSTQSWPGAYLMQGDAGGVDYDTEWNAVDSSSGSYWGYATGVLPTANPWLWDRGHTVNVAGYLTLTSCTESDIDADPTLNLALLGDELVNFTTATLETDGSYTLSGFKRGRRGTEWATATHAVGDEFVLAANLANEAIGLSEVGVNEHYKVQTLGRSIDAAPAIDVDFAGRTLMPYAPARVKWTTDGTDLFGEIIRRTRVGGSWTGGSTIPLSEASEAYEVDVYHSTTFKRTITVSGTNLFTYTAAQMSADSNVVASPPPINGYQMSDAVGRGFALAA